MPADRATHVLYALRIDDAMGWSDREKARVALDQALDATIPVDPETWGMSEQAQASLRAAESLFGPA